jgi:hypothetical protein
VDRSFKRSDQYRNILLFDTRGNLRLSVSDRPITHEAQIRRLVMDALRARSATFSDVYPMTIRGPYT